MRAYFPNLIAKKDVQMISPTAITAQYSTNQPQVQPQPVIQQNLAANHNQKKVGKEITRKFIKGSKSPHGSGNVTANQNMTDSRMQAIQFQKEQEILVSNVRGASEIIVLSDFNNHNHNNSHSPSLLVVDDYNRHVSQEGHNNGSNLQQSHAPVLRK